MSVYSDRANKVKDKIYIVVGTGRSGTSFITSCLIKSGVKMLKGGQINLENTDFRDVNKKILKEAGGDGFHPPSKEKIIKAGKKYRDEIKKLIERYKSNLWGFKDPRTTLTLPAYLDLFDGDVYLICCVRKFDKVVKSMFINNNNHSLASGVDFKNLTKEYINRLCDLIKDFGL